MKYLIAVALFASSLPVMADEWMPADTYREVTYLTFLSIDWAQTRNFIRNPRCYEHNVLLGEHPSQDKVDAAIIATALAHIYVARLLPEEWRAPFQYVSIGIEAGSVAHNFSIGIGAKF